MNEAGTMSWDAIIVKTSDPNFAKPAEDTQVLPMHLKRKRRPG
jgi:hypothetical protein